MQNYLYNISNIPIFANHIFDITVIFISYIIYSKHLLYIHLRAHYDDVIMTMLESQITSLTVVYSIVYTGVQQRKHQSSASLAFVREIHRGPVNFPHKWPVTRQMFPFDDVIMCIIYSTKSQNLSTCILATRVYIADVAWLMTVAIVSPFGKDCTGVVHECYARSII